MKDDEVLSDVSINVTGLPVNPFSVKKPNTTVAVIDVLLMGVVAIFSADLLGCVTDPF